VLGQLINAVLGNNFYLVGKIPSFFGVTADGTYSNHCAFNAK
jgi:hypothetical protein